MVDVTGPLFAAQINAGNDEFVALALVASDDLAAGVDHQCLILSDVNDPYWLVYRIPVLLVSWGTKIVLQCSSATTDGKSGRLSPKAMKHQLLKPPVIGAITTLLFAIIGYAAETGPQEIHYESSADGSQQPAMFYAPAQPDAVPLLVVLHTWSGDYKQGYHAACAAWCVAHHWAYIHPNFRGPNKRPEATGSKLVVGDIESAVEYAKRSTHIDASRIYLLGTSGGGYAALLMAGERPKIWAGVSAWAAISDLKAWYHETKRAGGDKHYYDDIAKSCGGPPGTSQTVDQEYLDRSPLTHLHGARGLALDINAGIHDGHEGSVPISHSLRAFNAVAASEDQFSEREITYFLKQAAVPPQLHQNVFDPTYGNKPPMFRRTSGRARVTIFDGGHELIPTAALEWLAKQRQNN
jgi:pimeloyl-ACP methyl ester carboxylesterase